MMTRAQRECASRPLELLSRTTGIVTAAINFASMAAILLTLDVPLLAAMVVICLPMLVVQMIYGAKTYTLEYGRTDTRRMIEILGGMQIDRKILPQIISFGLSDYLFGRWLGSAESFVQQDVRLHRNRTAAETLSSVLVTISTVGVTAYVVYLNFSRGLALTVGGVMMYVTAFGGGLGAWQGAMRSVTGIYEGSLFLLDLVAFHKLRPVQTLHRGGRSTPEAIHEIRFENVGFRYPNSAAWALRGVDLTFRHGQSTLLVGPNGAGKTTLTKLLIRLYDPTEGRILLDGVDLREFDLTSLRRRIGVVFQDFLCLPFTAQENIGCGDVRNMQDQARVREAARRAGAQEMIERLPAGFDTVLNRMFKDGQELSYGQWQRVCIARSFMKQAPVCVLDEPTASLDVEAEAALLREINRMSLASMCILISHRALRPGIADRIVVMSQGRIVESGDYTGLIARGGEFARLARLYQSAEAIQPESGFVESQATAIMSDDEAVGTRVGAAP
ncbi:MAG: ABC transporter ATP-binding protein [Phycisphaeraceae bacterium]|nr:ABC transporter ATP-binding protein [Phycisphaeraceae bacterium]